MIRITASSLVVISILATSARAALIFSDGFESYTASANPLDKNTAGPNSARQTVPAIRGLARRHRI